MILNSPLNAENEELSVPADFLNHVDETLHTWQGEIYDTIFYRVGNDNDDIQGFVMARCKKQIQNGYTQYAFMNATPVTTKPDSILIDDITELVHSSLKLSDLQQDLNPNYPNNRFVFGYAHDKEIYSLEVEGQKPDGVIEINVYDRIMYLWYYNDLKSNKRGGCLSYSVDVLSKMPKWSCCSSRLFICLETAPFPGSDFLTAAVSGSIPPENSSADSSW